MIRDRSMAYGKTFVEETAADFRSLLSVHRSPK